MTSATTPPADITARGYGLTATLSEGAVTVTATNRASTLALGSGQRTIFFREITAIEFKEPSILANGGIKIVDRVGLTQFIFLRKRRAEARALFDVIAAAVPAAVGLPTKGPLRSDRSEAHDLGSPGTIA